MPRSNKKDEKKHEPDVLLRNSTEYTTSMNQRIKDVQHDLDELNRVEAERLRVADDRNRGCGERLMNGLKLNKLYAVIISFFVAVLCLSGFGSMYYRRSGGKDLLAAGNEGSSESDDPMEQPLAAAMPDVPVINIADGGGRIPLGYEYVNVDFDFVNSNDVNLNDGHGKINEERVKLPISSQKKPAPIVVPKWLYTAENRIQTELSEEDSATLEVLKSFDTGPAAEDNSAITVRLSLRDRVEHYVSIRFDAMTMIDTSGKDEVNYHLHRVDSEQVYIRDLEFDYYDQIQQSWFSLNKHYSDMDLMKLNEAMRYSHHTVLMSERLHFIDWGAMTLADPLFSRIDKIRIHEFGPLWPAHQLSLALDENENYPWLYNDGTWHSFKPFYVTRILYSNIRQLYEIIQIGPNLFGLVIETTHVRDSGVNERFLIKLTESGWQRCAFAAQIKCDQNLPDFIDPDLINKHFEHFMNMVNLFHDPSCAILDTFKICLGVHHDGLIHQIVKFSPKTTQQQWMWGDPLNDKVDWSRIEDEHGPRLTAVTFDGVLVRQRQFLYEGRMYEAGLSLFTLNAGNFAAIGMLRITFDHWGNVLHVAARKHGEGFMKERPLRVMIGQPPREIPSVADYIKENWRNIITKPLEPIKDRTTNYEAMPFKVGGQQFYLTYTLTKKGTNEFRPLKREGANTLQFFL